MLRQPSPNAPLIVVAAITIFPGNRCSGPRRIEVPESTAQALQQGRGGIRSPRRRGRAESRVVRWPSARTGAGMRRDGCCSPDRPGQPAHDLAARVARHDELARDESVSPCSPLERSLRCAISSGGRTPGPLRETPRCSPRKHPARCTCAGATSKPVGPATSINDRTAWRTSAGVPNGMVVCTPMPPQNDRCGRTPRLSQRDVHRLWLDRVQDVDADLDKIGDDRLDLAVAVVEDQRARIGRLDTGDYARPSRLQPLPPDLGRYHHRHARHPHRRQD